jgi:hypothetical protein
VTHRESDVARLWGRGFTNAEISSRLRMGVRQIQRYKKNPQVIALATQIREQVNPSATDTLRELLTDPSPGIRLQAARTLLLTPLPQGEDDPEADDPDGTPRITVIERK